ncbi:hypothetical protein NEUTE1DRAFT_142063 [Neurospora tetrasperma FGSC 2508]|uniref:Secreted protein n=1 Tax=Neurospora tetrasperma (strain FGSC 2508 / ATCC MYA-4615 / P0657) TaxID=510951 RepID=F8N0K8_NEUT8|nr:uncharacterized protein NEUTE1DRAFT_142063 [Neurospora tetrasperma FGSC 2508]EGO52148.1 hypothetical protein NEUTE1DRAFT_142063 [Neurospora tetrasperma FGSC 2508]
MPLLVVVVVLRRLTRQAGTSFVDPALRTKLQAPQVVGFSSPLALNRFFTCQIISSAGSAWQIDLRFVSSAPDI